MGTQPVEDISAVLWRFQAWTGSRNAVEARPGVRELSDEEALESGRYKWKGADRSTAKRVQDEPDPAVATPLKDRDSKRRTVKKTGAKESITKPATVTKPGTQPAFRKVLAEAVQRSEIVAPAKQPEMARQTAISVRFAPQERALIKKRAAEAGVSASAYVRQCALEVEQLRAQVRDAIAAMERGVPAPVGAQIPKPAFFARIARRFFQKRMPSLALRA